MTRLKYLPIVLFSTLLAHAQALKPGELSFNEYIGYVKKFHPLVRQANLEVTAAQAELMQARGAFDPKIAVDFDKKQFKGTEYYSLLNSSFKIPTWYGIEIKAGFDNSEGIYVNPQNTTPNSGLTSLGISIPLGQGLFVDRRMTDLRAAKVQLKLSEAERRLRATDALYEAALAYFHWNKVHRQVALYTNYLKFAEERFGGIRKLIASGDKPAVDSIEAGITVKSRKLSLEDAQMKLAKARLELSNFLWIENVPVELADNVIPEQNIEQSAPEVLGVQEFLQGLPPVDSHPKIMALESKLNILELERKFKANLLLPRVDVSYNYLSEPSYFDNYRLEDYKVGLNFSFPIFLRKERGGLKLAKIKIQDGQLDLELQRTALKNKLLAQQTEVLSIISQKKTVDELVKDYTLMLESEDRLFDFGESSVFLINTRENNLVSALLQQIDIQNRLLDSTAEFFKVVGNPD